jgi:hypothetical protein
MKHITSLLFLICIFSCNHGQKKNIAEIHPDWKTFSEKNYTVLYPPDWEMNKSGSLGTAFSILEPAKSKEDKFRENIQSCYKGKYQGPET